MDNLKIKAWGEKKIRLKELLHVTYNCEDQINGEYNPNSEDNIEFNEINDAYYNALKHLRNLIGQINSTLLRWPDNDEL